MMTTPPFENIFQTFCWDCDGDYTRQIWTL